MDKLVLKPKSLFFMFVGGSFTVYCLTHSIFKVEPGYNALKFNKFYGLKKKRFKEGLHMVIPYFEYPIIYDCKMASKVYDVHCGTKGSLYNF